MPPKRLTLIAATVTGLLATSPARAIVGGTADMALARSSIMVLKSSGGVCSGIIITKSVVLTAAHCATGADQFRIHYRDMNGEAIMIEPAAKILHPKYVAGAIQARKPSVDMALFRLRVPLPRSFSVATLSQRQPHAEARITIGGYGFSKAGDPRSMGIFRTVEFTVQEPYGAGKLLIWAKGRNGTEVCTGDSGGPLVSAGTIFAITAWADVSRKSLCGRSIQGVLLGPQREWIDSTLSGWGEKARWED